MERGVVFLSKPESRLSACLSVAADVITVAGFILALFEHFNAQ